MRTRPSAGGGGKLSVTDGPFAESKEAVGGYAIVQAYTYGETDWTRIATLYGLFAARTPSPVVELNRAVAVSMADGPGPALEIVGHLTTEPALRDCHLPPASAAASSPASAVRRRPGRSSSGRRS